MNDYYHDDWLKELSAIKAIDVNQKEKKVVTKRVAYVLSLEHGINIDVFYASVKKDGSISVSSKRADLSGLLSRLPEYLTYRDCAAVSMLCKIENSTRSHDKTYSDLLQTMLETNRLIFAASNKQLIAGKDKKIDFEWCIDEHGNQSIKAKDKNYIIFPLYRPMYIDLKACTIGGIITENLTLFNHLLKAKEIRPKDIKVIRNAISATDGNNNNFLPKEINITKDVSVIPKVNLRFFGQEVHIVPARTSKKLVMLDVSFDYDGHIITMDHLSFKIDHYNRYRNGVLERVFYAPKEERGILDRIQSIAPLQLVHDLKSRNILDYWTPHSIMFCYTYIDNIKKPDIEKINLLWKNLIKIAKERGWKTIIDKSFPIENMHQIEDWFTDVVETDKNNWFDIDMGIQVEGKKLSLLPVLYNMLKEPNIFENLDKIPDKKYQIDIEGYRLNLPGDRVYVMLKFLKDVYNRINNKSRSLQVSNIDMARLAEFEAATTALGMRWMNKTKITEIGRKLLNFAGIKDVQIPKIFTANLRPYQQEGVNWLQFLQEYGLAGILADDMGLGKTVQTLAHIAIEKEKGLKNPFLVIAPTTVMVNWLLEAARFVPNLKIIELKAGADRKKKIEKLSDFDLVLTSYSLVLRDKEELLKQEFYSIILDEAQYIKNNKAKITSIVNQLKTTHRLCLTGTPLENHLGELWSLFNFLMPGFLGDETGFTKHYRTPIEKKQDQDCRVSLIRRISPFMLRRTKDKVAKELPGKTEIIQLSELVDKQADLYEAIRLSMHEKVSTEIASKGLARSHIFLLDALLKLRQICCHPKLLKMDLAKDVNTSAKMEQLLQMLSGMIEEGHKVVIFSQFVSMIELIEIELKSLHIQYAKIVGDTKNRLKQIEDFQSSKVNLFLISLKAGGTGINLTAADTVIHFDPWWNPAVEQQATDRVHRIGQDKPVFVYKMITSSSVEEKILTMQAKKAKLAEAIFDVEKSSVSQITMEDVNSLFAPLRS